MIMIIWYRYRCRYNDTLSAVVILSSFRSRNETMAMYNKAVQNMLKVMPLVALDSGSRGTTERNISPTCRAVSKEVDFRL